MPDDVVPKSFRNAVLEIENDLWRDVPNDIIAQANDIFKAVFQTNGLTTCLANTYLLIRFFAKEKRYDFNVCYQCKQGSKHLFLRECLMPEDALKKFVEDCNNSSVNVAAMHILVVYNLTDDPEHCPDKFKYDFALHANMLLVDKFQKKAHVTDPNSMEDAQVRSYIENFQTLALEALQEWNIRELSISREAECSYRHNRLCRYANVLTYIIPETQSSAKAFCRAIIQTIKRIYGFRHFGTVDFDSVVDKSEIVSFTCGYCGKQLRANVPVTRRNVAAVCPNCKTQTIVRATVANKSGAFGGSAASGNPDTT